VGVLLSCSCFFVCWAAVHTHCHCFAMPAWTRAVTSLLLLLLLPYCAASRVCCCIVLTFARVPVLLSCRPAALAWHHPTWWFVDYANANKQWAAEREAYEAEFGKGSAELQVRQGL
jgi:hypothetical protein